MFRAWKVRRGRDTHAQTSNADLGKDAYESHPSISTKNKSVQLAECSRVSSSSHSHTRTQETLDAYKSRGFLSKIPSFPKFTSTRTKKTFEVPSSSSHSIASPTRSQEAVGVNDTNELNTSRNIKRKSRTFSSTLSAPSSSAHSIASSSAHSIASPTRSIETVGVNDTNELNTSRNIKRKSRTFSSTLSAPLSSAHSIASPTRSIETVGVNDTNEYDSFVGGDTSLPSLEDDMPNDEDYATHDEELQNEEEESDSISINYSSDDMSNNNNSSSSISSLDREFEIIDGQGITTTKKGRFSSKHVYGLPPGSKIVVKLNEENQPIKRGGLILRRFIGRTVRKEKIVGLAYRTWKHLEKERKKQIVKYIRTKFHIQEGAHVDRIILLHCNNKWRSYKCNLKKRVTKNGEYSKEVAYDNRPSGIDADVWVNLVGYWYSKEFKMISKDAKISRAAKMHVHTTGAKSFAEKRDELEEEHDREIGPVEFFKECHMTKDRSYIDPASETYVEKATEYVREKISFSKFSSSTVGAEYEAHYELRGPDKGRVKGYGLGVMPSQFRGGRSNQEASNRDEDVRSLRDEVKTLREQAAMQMSMLANVQAQLAALTNTTIHS